MTTLIIAQLTIRETQRRRILWVVVLLAIVFLALYGAGLYYIFRDSGQNLARRADPSLMSNGLLTIGLYATNFLVALMAVLMSAASISGEVESHTIDTLVTKPLRRWEIILGKWLGFALLLVGYILLLPGGVILISNWITGARVTNFWPGMSLILLQGLILLSLSLAGGTRVSTLANGAMALMIYGIAFLGSWIEQIGALFENETAVNIGIITSLIMPSEALWRKAMVLFLPSFANTPVLAGPFAVASQPSDLMLAYAVVYMLVLLALALYSFSTRDL